MNFPFVAPHPDRLTAPILQYAVHSSPSKLRLTQRFPSPVQ